MLIKLIKFVNFKDAHIENNLMHLTESLIVKLLQIVVSDVSPKQVLVPILLIELLLFPVDRDTHEFFCHLQSNVFDAASLF